MAKEYLTVDGKLVTIDGELVQVPDAEQLNDIADENGAYATQNQALTDDIEELIVNGVIDGSPRDVYDSLEALQTAYPSGASGVYLTSDNGHWYWWNGSSWNDGGVYQATGLDDETQKIINDTESILYKYFDIGKKVLKATFEIGTPKMYGGGYVIDKTEANRLGAFIGNLDIKVGYTISLPNYDTYDYAIGENDADGYRWIPNGTGGYLGKDYTFTADDVLHTKVVIVKKKDNSTMTQTDVDYISNNLTIGKNGKNRETLSFKQDIFNYYDKRFMHFSFDDVSICLQNLVSNKTTFTSIFKDPFLAKLKYWHDTYNAKFSLYVYYSNFKNLDNTYKQEFKDNADWLKFGLHIGENIENYNSANATYDKANSDYLAFLNKALEIGGTLDIVDRCPRLHNFGGNEVSLLGMKDTLGFIGCLTADDNRDSVYLTQKQQQYLLTHDKLYDERLDLLFLSTDMRLDWFMSGFTSSNTYDVPVKNNPYEELVYRLSLKDKLDKYDSIIVFTHEWQLYSTNHNLITTMANYIEQVFKFANDYNIPFDYPQYKFNSIVNYSNSNPFKIREEIVIDEWQNKAITSEGNLVDSTTRITNTKPLFLKNGDILVIKAPSGYKVNVVSYNNNNTIASTMTAFGDWQTTNQKILGDGKTYYKIALAKIDNSTVDETLSDSFTFILEHY